VSWVGIVETKKGFWLKGERRWRRKEILGAEFLRGGDRREKADIRVGLGQIKKKKKSSSSRA